MADQGVHDEQAAKRARVGEGEAANKVDGELHALIDPSLAALRQALAVNLNGRSGKWVPGVVTVPVASPLAGDTRAAPFAANLLDLRVRGRGASEAESCLTSRLELASVSRYYAGLSTHKQRGDSLELPVGHAGVRLLLDALYTKRVQLGPVEVVDLLQAASYLQVECCLSAASEFLREHVCRAHPAPVLRVAQALGLQDLQQHVVIETMARSFTFLGAPLLARLLAELGTEAAEALLQRDDLCCPLEPFLIQVLLSPELLEPAAEGRPGVDVERLLGCVRWGSMPPEQLRAAALYARRVRSERPEVPATVAWRLAEHLASSPQRDGLSAPSPPRSGSRTVAEYTAWLHVDLGADGSLPSQSMTASFPCLERRSNNRACLELGTSAEEPAAPRLKLKLTGRFALDPHFNFGFLAWNSKGIRILHGRRTAVVGKASGSGVQDPSYEDGSLLSAALKQPLEDVDSQKSLLLACCVPPPPPSCILAS